MKNKLIHRDSINLTEDYIQEDLEEFISIEKYDILEKRSGKNSKLV